MRAPPHSNTNLTPLHSTTTSNTRCGRVSHYPYWAVLSDLTSVCVTAQYRPRKPYARHPLPVWSLCAYRHPIPSLAGAYGATLDSQESALDGSHQEKPAWDANDSSAPAYWSLSALGMTARTSTIFNKCTTQDGTAFLPCLRLGRMRRPRASANGFEAASLRLSLYTVLSRTRREYLPGLSSSACPTKIGISSWWRCSCFSWSCIHRSAMAFQPYPGSTVACLLVSLSGDSQLSADWFSL